MPGRNVIYYNSSNSQIPLAGIANLPYTDVILGFLYPDDNGNVQLGESGPTMKALEATSGHCKAWARMF